MVIDALTIAGTILALIAIAAVVKVCHASGVNCLDKR